MLAKFKHLEILIFIVTLIGTLIAFFYCEESISLRIVSVFLAIIALLYGLKNTKSKTVSSQYEFLSLLTVYLGIFCAYNFLYLLNVPLYAAMLLVLVIVIVVTYCMFSLDKIQTHLSKEVFLTIIVLFGLVSLEIFLALYFLSVKLAIKSLVLSVMYYLLINLVYLYVNSMLRLKKVIGFLIISIIILAAAVLGLYLGLSR